MKKFLILLFAASAGHCALAADQSFSYVDLVHRLTDLEYLATVPAPGETCSQWSSYDRRSRYDAATGKYVGWDANGDGNGIIRKEGDKLILAEMEAPGCIYRIWSATPKEGHVRVYLDGATEPAIDLPFTGYFDRKNAPFTRPTLVHTVANGWNNFIPIPYQKSCKIVADTGWGDYYHFAYVTFPKGTKVPTFKRELSRDENAALDKADEVLARCEPVDSGSSAQPLVERTVTLQPGKTESVVELDGPLAIRRLRLKLEPPATHEDRDLLRELTLQIRWDDEREPSVWAPLGDFFGTAPGANLYKSYPLGLGQDGWWYCNWYMPFARRASLQISNDGKAARKVTVELSTAQPARPVNQLALFHAKWHRDAFLPSEPERQIDWTMLKTEGIGRFVGVMLHIWNPRGGWWGEGDEKFFVDGEKFPSTFGTGSEDYFGYAWSSPKLFQHPLHNQTCNDGNSRGHISVNRWHIADAIPFHNSFEGDIEKYYPNEKPTLYSATAYWYQASGGKDPYPAVPVNERLGYWAPVQSVKVPGVLEGETLKILSKTGGEPQEQDMTGFAGQWSNDAHLWWINAKPGDKLVLSLPVVKSAKYHVLAQLTRAPDYGIVQLSVDGEKLGGPQDLYHKSVVATGQLDLGQRELSAGEHKLEVEILGANPAAIKNYMFGLDYVKLQPIPSGI